MQCYRLSLSLSLLGAVEALEKGLKLMQKQESKGERESKSDKKENKSGKKGKKKVVVVDSDSEERY